MHCEKLADTLETIADDNGAWNMYNGSLARDIVQDLRDIGVLNKTVTMCRITIPPSPSPLSYC